MARSHGSSSPISGPNIPSVAKAEPLVTPIWGLNKKFTPELVMSPGMSADLAMPPRE
ncbi:MAG: hypothetical protein WCO00_06185 [Rhodospirillaceae bacterium]